MAEVEVEVLLLSSEFCHHEGVAQSHGEGVRCEMFIEHTCYPAAFSLLQSLYYLVHWSAGKIRRVGTVGLLLLPQRVLLLAC